MVSKAPSRFSFPLSSVAASHNTATCMVIQTSEAARSRIYHQIHAFQQERFGVQPHKNSKFQPPKTDPGSGRKSNYSSLRFATLNVPLNTAKFVPTLPDPVSE